MMNVRIIKRERVNRMLESIFDYPLTIVEAPVGYGKTTSVREFLFAKGCPVIWISFQSAEDTAAFFWDRLSAEIGRFHTTAGAALKSLGFPIGAPQTAAVLSILEDIEYEDNTALVFDDFHLAGDPQIGKLIRGIVQREPNNLHIVIITRDTTNLNFPELSAKGLYHIFPQQTLSFTKDEIRDYCAVMGFKPGAGQLQKICEATGGWISLVYLTLCGMEKGIPVGRNNAIDDLIENVLYNAYDERTRVFLLRLSVMDGFTAEQARYVTKESRADELLHKLRRENAFVFFNEAEGVYKIHNMLLDFLRDRRKGGAESRKLYRRLGEWFIERRQYMPAYRYLYRAGETERILARMDDESSITNDFAGFEGAFDMFAAAPRQTLFKYPLAYLQYIGLLLVSGDAGLAREGVQRLDELQTAYEKADIQCSRRSRVLGEISAIRIFAVFNDMEKMAACAKDALRLLGDGVSSLIRREAESTFGSPHFLYTYYRETGRLKETADFIASEFGVLPRLADGCGTGCGHAALAEYALETGDGKTAEMNAYRAIYKAKTKNQIGVILCANFTLIRLYLYQGKIAEGLELLSQLREEITTANNAIFNTTLELVEGYVYGCLSQRDSIPAWLRTGDMSSAHFMYQGMGFGCIVYGRAMLLSGNWLKMEALTEEFEQYFSVFQNQLGFLHNQILKAAAKYRLYGLAEGNEALQKALDMAREDGVVMPFAEYAPYITDMLRQLARSAERDDHLDQVILVCEQYYASMRRYPKVSSVLSGREREVLALTAKGLRRGEIAERLHISAGTVKMHLENIYRKLGAEGKTSAIYKAQAMKLI